ncbi:MAG: SH3 domain-containing protein [Dehalococcoidia bacterium]
MRIPHARVARPALWLALVPILVIAAVSPFAALGEGLIIAERPVDLAIEAPLGSSLLTVAVQSIGGYGGECFTWVRSVVQRATGRTIGFSYRQGFLDAGAVEVQLDSARAGDIIQIVNDFDDGPGADYPGLHTSIVLNVDGGGVFRVIDSNLSFDGIVRVRDRYNPVALAARYPNLNVHVFRFLEPIGGATTTSEVGERPLPSSSGATPMLAVGDPPAAPYSVGAAIRQVTGGSAGSPQQATGSAVVRAEGDCLRLRAAPSTSAAVLTCIADGATVSLLSGTQQADGVLWQSLVASGQTGWAASQYLVRTGGAATVPAPAFSTPVASTPVASVAAPAPAAPPAGIPASASEGAPAVIGDLPAGGGLALVVYSGGPVNGLLSVTSQRGCGAISIWASRSGGGLVGMIPGAPALVNREWRGEFPADNLAARTPLIVVCGGGTPAPSVAAAPGPGAPPTTSARGGTTPPGPAGNE